MRHPLIPLIIALLFLILRNILHTLRNIVWLMNGTRRLVIENRKEENYERSAHVLRIAGRYRYDSVAVSTRLRDFILYHDGFAHPEYVLRDEVTLYHVDHRQGALFVECPDGDSPWRLDDHSFSRDGQFRKARRVIVLPLASFYRLADRVGPPSGKLVFIGNIARCGSTLLSQAFEKTGRFVSYTEPAAISDLIDCTDPTVGADRRHVLAAVSLLCKDRLNGPSIDGHAVKLMAPVTGVLPMLRAVFPDAHFLFLYRHHLASMKSLASLTPMLPFAYLQRLLDRWCPALAVRHAVYQRFAGSGRTTDDCRLDTSTPWSFVITKILAPTFVFHRCLKSGFRMPAFRFEDLTARPERTLAAIFRHCQIPDEYLRPALKAMDVDSQEKSMLSRKNTTYKKTPVFGDDDLRLIRELCRRNDIPDVLDNPILEGTTLIEEIVK